MEEVDQLIMIIPVVLNLKGNLEMNLSARLGTAANVGELDDPKTRRSMVLGNLSLLQVQAAAVSFVAACVSLILGLFVPRILPLKSTTASRAIAQSKSVIPNNSHILVALSARRPRPPLPVNDGRRKSGLVEYVFTVLLLILS